MATLRSRLGAGGAAMEALIGLLLPAKSHGADVGLAR
jgi:hypothetical protein